MLFWFIKHLHKVYMTGKIASKTLSLWEVAFAEKIIDVTIDKNIYQKSGSIFTLYQAGSNRTLNVPSKSVEQNATSASLSFFVTDLCSFVRAPSPLEVNI